jgi:hypothetical protein
MPRKGLKRHTSADRPKEKRIAPDVKVVIQSYVPRYVRDAVDKYIWAFNRDNPGAGMTTSKLSAAILIKHLREAGILDESTY